MCNFTHLHVHSDGSTAISKDGLGNVARLVKGAKEKGFETLALTDHGNLINTPSFMSACKQQNIKPILGLEAYVEHEGDNYHLTLLSDGNIGYDNLVHLNNIAQQNYVNRRPAFNLTDFEKYNEGIIVLTGCPSSPLQRLNYNDAVNMGLYLKGVFKERLFAEIMFVGYNGNEPLERSVKLANKLKIPIITTNDAHFPYANDAKVHEVLTSIRGGYDYPSEYLFLATEQELQTRVKSIAPDYLSYYEQGVRNAQKLANKLTPVKFDNALKLPKIDNPTLELNKLIIYGLSKRVNDKTLSLENEVYERLQYEFDVINSMGFAAYFIILNDMVNYAKSINVKVGAGRGSGAGSLILYTLGITDINPLEYDLKFERFINPKRLDFPDVDIDYSPKGRGYVIQYAKERWCGIPVATYSRYSEDSLHNDLAKYFEMDKITKDKIKDEGINDETYKKYIETNHLYDDCYQAILHQIRHIGKHAGGVVITDKNIPTIQTTSGEIVASWIEGLHDKELSEMGIVKYDILGISALEIIEELEQKHGAAPKPTDDSPIFDIFKKGDTLGIFQFTQSGITEFTKKIQPTKFSELVAINAVWRPGAMQAAGVHYPEYKKNGQRLLHPLIDDILAETYGVIVYQEQFMSIYARVTGKDFGDADLARKILVKGQGKENNPEWKAKLDKLRDEFLEGCKKSKIDDKTANLIWSEIKTHSGYSFNKSHSVSYTMLSWQLAYYKYHYRADFYAASLNANDDNDDKRQQFLFDVIKSGIEVVSPDINKSTDKYVSDGDKIYMPLTAIKGLKNGYESIMINRPFKSIDDFNERVPKRKVNSRVRTKLQELGCFDSIRHDDTLFGDLFDDLPKKSLAEIQKECYGFVLPTPKFFESVEYALANGFQAAGRISKIEEKKTKNGNEYLRLFLYPSGIIRSYILDSGFNIGDDVQIKCHPNIEYGLQAISIGELEYV